MSAVDDEASMKAAVNGKCVVGEKGFTPAGVARGRAGNEVR